MSLSSISSSHMSFTSDGTASAGNTESTLSFPQIVEGYDHEFVSQPESRYECPICLLVLREPFQTKCGHIFCEDCIKKSLRNQSRCPVDNEPLKENEIYPDNFARREIMNFNIKCPNNDGGCDKIITLGKLQNHLDDCDFAVVPCLYKCSCKIRRGDISNHLSTSCENRLVKCEHCHNSMQANVIEDHIKVCPRVTVICLFCKEERARCQIENHIQNECQQVEVECPFHVMGCTNRMVRSSIDDHLKSESSSHLKQLCQTVTGLAQKLSITSLNFHSSSQNLTNGCSSGSSVSFQDLSLSGASAGSDILMAQLQTLRLDHDQRREGENGSNVGSDMLTFYSPGTKQSVYNHHMTERNGHASMDQRNGALLPEPREKKPVHRLCYPQTSNSTNWTPDLRNPSHLQEQAGKIPDNTDSELLKAFQKMNTRNEEKEQEIRELQNKILAVERANANLTKMVKNLELSLNDKSARFCNGEFFWSISQFSHYRQKLEAGESSILHSPPFHTSPWGYKLCIRANIDRSTVAGEHLSLFVHFMKSSNDAFLTWPFSGKITICVLDQNPDVSRRQHMMETLEANPNLAAFQKPTTPRNYKGFGYVEFLSISALVNGTFLMDDTLVVKTQVFPNSR